MNAVRIYAPVSIDGARWVRVVFLPGRDDNDQFRRGIGVRFAGKSPEGALYSLKQRLVPSLGFLSGESRDRFLRGCPLVRIHEKDEGCALVTLSTEEQRSWEMAYLLSCLAAAGIGAFSTDVRYVATGHLDDGRFVAADLEEKLRYVLGLDGRIVFLTPGGQDRVSTDKCVVLVPDVRALLEHPRSPLSANAGADLEALRRTTLTAFDRERRSLPLEVLAGATRYDALSAVRAAAGPLLIRAESGAGKTDLLRRLALHAAEGHWSDTVDLCVPPVDLRGLRPRQGAEVDVDTLLHLLGKELRAFGAYRTQPSPEQVRALLESRRALVLLDGVNEVEELHRDAVARAVADLVRSLRSSRNHRYVMTDQRQSWFGGEGWDVARLQPLRDDQLRIFLAASIDEETARRLLAQPWDLLRLPVVARMVTDMANPATALRGGREQVTHAYVRDRLSRWAKGEETAAAVEDLERAAELLAVTFGGRAFPVEEARRTVDELRLRKAEDPVAALIVCGLLLKDERRTGLLRFWHDTVLSYFRAGSVAARWAAGESLPNSLLADPANEAWLLYLAVHLPRGQKHRIVEVARELPALGARLADSIHEDNPKAVEPALASIAASAKSMRKRRTIIAGGAQSLAMFGTLFAFMVGLYADRVFTKLGTWGEGERLIEYGYYGEFFRGSVINLVVSLIGGACGAAMSWGLGRLGGGDGVNNAALMKLLATTMDVRPGKVRDVLLKNVREVAQSRDVAWGVRGYALVLSAESDAAQWPFDATDLEPLGFLKNAAAASALHSGILALEHIRDPRVAPILAYLLRQEGPHAEDAARATVARARRYPEPYFWLEGNHADPRALAAQRAGQARRRHVVPWDRGRKVLAGLVLLWAACVATGGMGWSLIWWLIAIAIFVDAGRLMALSAPDKGRRGRPAEVGLIMALLLAAVSPRYGVGFVFGFYLLTRERIRRSAAGIDWADLTQYVAAVEGRAGA